MTSFDAVRQTSTSTGVGDIVLRAASTGFRSFASVHAVGATVHYCIEGRNASGVFTGQREIGLGRLANASVFQRLFVEFGSTGATFQNFTSAVLEVADTVSVSAVLDLVSSATIASSQVVGFGTAAGAATTDFAPATHTHTASSISGITDYTLLSVHSAHVASLTAHGISSYGASLVSATSAAMARTVLGLGSAAVAATSDFAAASHTHVVGDITNVNTSRLLGRHSAGTGTAQELGIDGGLELNGANLRRSAITGAVSIDAGGTTATLNAGVVGTPQLGGDITTTGATLLVQSSIPNVRSVLGLGSMAVASTADYTLLSVHSAHVASLTAHGISAYGASVVSAASAGQLRATLGLGSAAVAATSDFATADHIHTAASISGITDYTLLSTHSAHVGLLTAHGISSYGASVVSAASAGQLRATLGLGSAAVAATSDFSAATHVHSLASVGFPMPTADDQTLTQIDGILGWYSRVISTQGFILFTSSGVGVYQ